MTTSSTGSSTHDVIVVGDGPAGVSLGVVLARRGVRVAVVGRPPRPAAPAAGLLGAFGEVTASSLRSEHGRTLIDLRYRASRMWPDWLASLSPDRDGTAGADGTDLLTAEGTVVVLNTIGLPEIDDDNYRAVRTALTDHDEDVEDLDPEEIDWLDPEPTARPLRAMFLPHEHAVDVVALYDRLGRAVRAAGGELVTARATGVEHSGGRATGVRLASGSVLPAGQVVLADGADTQALLDTVPDVAAAIPRLRTSTAVSALVDTPDGTAPPSVIRTPNRAVAGGGVHVSGAGHGTAQIGSVETVTPQPRGTASLSDTLHLLDAGARQIRRALGESGLRRMQVANRPVTADGLPLLGPTGLDGLWTMAGTYRDELVLSPLLASGFADLVTGGPATVDLGAFAPVRSPLDPLGRGEIVESTVAHVMAAGYEANWRTPVEWPGLLEATLVAELFRDPPEVVGEVGVRQRGHR